MGKRVLITGATSGIGRELARQFCRLGWEVILLGRSRVKLEVLEGELKARFACQLESICLDLRLTEQVQELDIDGLDLDMLINCAGMGIMGDFERLTAEQELAMIQVNLLATVVLSKKCCQAFVKKGRGQLINVSSTAAFYSNPGLNIYSATKAFVFNYSLALAQEVKRYSPHIKVLTICPGPTKTGFFAKETRARLVSDTSDYFEMTPETVAKLVIRQLGRKRPYYIVGQRNKWLTRLLNILPLSWRLSVLDGYIGKGWR